MEVTTHSCHSSQEVFSFNQVHATMCTVYCNTILPVALYLIVYCVCRNGHKKVTRNVLYPSAR